MNELTGALACVFALIILVCAIWIARDSMKHRNDFYDDAPELRFTSQGRVLRIDRYDENEV